jgi:branched-chain amino acid transport system permease protein
MIGLPEVFRFVKDWRDAFVGLAMVVMMIFRPGGLLPRRRRVAAELETNEATANQARCIFVQLLDRSRLSKERLWRYLR